MAVLDRFDPWDEEYWENWGNSNLSVDCLHWELTLAKHNRDFFFCDPPYYGLEDYYGQYETRKTKYKQEKFDHELLAQRLSEHKNGGIVTYQDDPKGYIKSLYSQYKCFDIIETRWHQGSRKSQGSDEATELIILKEPAMRPSKRAKRQINPEELEEFDLIGDPTKIARVYGGYYLKPPFCKEGSSMPYAPETLCEFLELYFSCAHPEYPCRIDLESLLRNIKYDRYSCTKDDVRAIIKSMIERKIIEVNRDNSHNHPRFGYPKYEVKNMNKHIIEMREQGIPVKAGEHFSYDYDPHA